MKRTLDEHAARFDERAEEYDASKSPEYHDCLARVIELASVRSDDTVLDIGTGTGAVALALAADVERVIGRDISEGMLAEARRKATADGLSNVSFDLGRFLAPNYRGDADVITSNFAMHHLDDERKRRAIAQLTEQYQPRRFILGDVMFFGHPDPAEPFYSPEVDDPATVGHLVESFTDTGYAVTHACSIHPQVGVLVAVPRSSLTD